jgi:hypothetical protein
VDLFTWKSLDATILFLLCVFCVTVYPNRYLALFSLIVLAGVPYVWLSIKTGVLNARLKSSEDLNSNLSFNHWFMSSWCSAYENAFKVNVSKLLRRGFQAGLLIFPFVYLLPVRFLVLFVSFGIAALNLPPSHQPLVLRRIKSRLV